MTEDTGAGVRSLRSDVRDAERGRSSSWSALRSGPLPSRWRAVLLGTLLAAWLPGAVVAHAAGNVWSATGGGGLISSIAVDPMTPGTLYATSNGHGLFKSTNGGASWTRVTSIPETGLSNVAVDPSTSSVMYVTTGSPGAGVYKSTDGGVTWENSSAGLLDAASGIVIDPSATGTLYVRSGVGVFKSTDGGASWSSVSTGLFGSFTTALAIDPLAPQVLYLGIDGGGTFKTINGGASWSLVGGFAATALAVDPVTPGTVYAGQNGALNKTTNGGATWTPIATGLPINALAIDPGTPATLYAASSDDLVYKSTNGGSSFSLANTGLNSAGPVVALAIDPSSPSVIFAGTEGGVYRSTDGAATWGSGPMLDVVFAMAVDPVVPTNVYAAGNRMFARSTDGGLTWAAAGVGLPSGPQQYEAIVVDSATPATLYLGGRNSGVFKSTDGGTSWTSASTGLGTIDVRALAIDPATPGTLYAGTTGGGVFRTTNGGSSWTVANTGLTHLDVRAIAIDPVTPTTILVGAQTVDGSSRRVFKSTDGGATWSDSSTGLGNATVLSIAIDPTNPSRAYAGTLQGVFKSTNGGASWASSSTGISGLPYAGAVVVDPNRPDFVYAGLSSSNGGVFKSINGGATWRAINDGLFVFPNNPILVRALAISPVDGQVLYAGSSEAGVFRVDQRCDNGTIDAGEQCDAGALNADPAGCCSAACAFRTGEVCRPSAGACDVADTCDGSGSACPADTKSTAICRSAADVCDLAESCDGVSDGCPTDVLAPTGTPCRNVAGECDLAEACTGLDVTCPADGKSTAVCRAPANACDVAESCDGSSDTCPADDIGDGRACEDGNACTVGDTCLAGSCTTGVLRDCSDGNVCTSDGCNAATGCTYVPAPGPCNDGLFCTVGDSCSGGACVGGSARDCSAAADQCNTGACDETRDSCTGAPVPNGTACGDGNACTLSDQCVAGQCAGASPGCGDGVVDLACGELCDDGALPATGGDGCSATCSVEEGWSCSGQPSECELACGNGVVDPGESCDDGDLNGKDGCSTTCTIENGWSCSGAPSECDPVCGDAIKVGSEQCDVGSPPDDGDADGCEANCTLSPKVIPPAALPPGGTLRSDVENDGASAGDPLETSVTTPAAGTVSITRAPATGPIDTGYGLLGQQVVISAPPATAVDPLRFVFVLDRSLWLGQAPQAIVVQRNGAPLPVCNGPDGQAVPGPACVKSRTLQANGEDLEITVLTEQASTWTFLADVCGAAPRLDCRVPIQSRKSSVKIKDVANDARDLFQWTWPNGAATTAGDLGNPTTTTDYTVCVYDQNGLYLRAAVAPGGTCDGKPCWAAKPKGTFLYKDKAATADGVQQILLKSGGAGKARLQVKGKGAGLKVSAPLGIVPPLTVQLRSSAGSCWGAAFGSPSKNDADDFVAKAD